MAKAKCSSMQDFLVTFFVENRMVSRMLSEVLKNRNDRLPTMKPTRKTASRSSIWAIIRFRWKRRTISASS